MKSPAVGAAAAALLLGTAAQAADVARYEIRFDATWTAASHPSDYPANAHFSGLIGTTHGKSFRVFQDGAMATPGLKALSEAGAHTPLNTEIEAALKEGKAGFLFESGPLFTFPGSISATFIADESNPYVSAVAMIAPSPDWFTGISNVALRADGKWVDRMTLTLYAWDAGTDSGTTYQSADEETQPRQSVRLNAASQMFDGVTVKPVGTVTLTRVKTTASNHN